MLRRVAMLAAGLVLTGAGCALAGDLTVTFKGVRSDKGKLSAGLFGEKDGWPDGKTFAVMDAAPKIGQVTYVFKNLPPGRYAISAFHDENANGKFDTNFIGLPKEGFAFSNDVKPKLSPPSFKDASFAVGANPVAITLHVEYWASTR